MTVKIRNGGEIMAEGWKVEISGAGVVSMLVGPVRIAIPHGDYEMTKLPDGNYELRSGDKLFTLDKNDIPQYLENGTLKIEGVFPF